MKKVFFALTIAATAVLTSCGNGKPPTMFIPCVTTGENPADRSECDCKTSIRVHQSDTASFDHRFFRENKKVGRAFWAGYVYIL